MHQSSDIYHYALKGYKGGVGGGGVIMVKESEREIRKDKRKSRKHEKKIKGKIDAF
jgi:hypothetical protein